MATFSDLIAEEEKKKKKPSQIAAQENKENATATTFADLIDQEQKQKEPQPITTPKPTTTPQPQQEQPNNFLQQAVSTITNAITSALGNIANKNFLSEKPQDIIKSNPTQPNQNTQSVNNPAIKPDFNNNNAEKSAQVKNTPQLQEHQQQEINNFNTVSNLIDSAAKQYIPQTRQIAQEFNIDPLNLKTDPKKAISDIAKKFDNPQQSLQEVFNIAKDDYDALSAKAKEVTGAKTTPEKIGKAADTAATAGNIIFSPISALFNEAEKYPVLGSVARLVTLPFTLIGEGAADTSNKIIDSLPLTTQDKNSLKPGVGEIVALASQIALGKATDLGAKKTELTTKFGEKDAQTIINKAQELADEKKQQQSNDTQNSVVLTPEQARTQVQATDLNGTPAGDALVQAANEAEKNGKSLQITARPQEKPTAKTQEQKLLTATNPQNGAVQGNGFTMTDKPNRQNLEQMKQINDYRKKVDSFNKNPTPTKLKNVQKARSLLQTPKGTQFNIDFVEPIKMELINDSNKTIGQIQQETQSPDLTRYENAFNTNNKAVLDELATKYPNDTRFQVHKKFNGTQNGLSDTGKEIKLYRGGKDDAPYTSTHRHIAEDYAKNRGGEVFEYKLNPKAKIINYIDIPNTKYKNIDDYNVEDYAVRKGKSTLRFMEDDLEVDYSKATTWAKENGYDAVKFPTEGEVRIINNKVITSKSQNSTIEQSTTLFHGTNNTPEVINTEGLHLSRNASKQLGQAVYFTDSAATVVDHGTNYVSIKGDNFKLKSFKTLQEQEDFIKQQRADNLAEAIRKEGTYDGFSIPNPDPKVGTTIGIVDLNKVNEQVIGKNAAKSTPLDFNELQAQVQNDIRLQNIAPKVEKRRAIIQGENGQENRSSNNGGREISPSRNAGQEGATKQQAGSTNPVQRNDTTVSGTGVQPQAGEKTPSKIARSIEQKAIEQKLTKGFEGLAGYDKITIKDQAERATKVFENIDQAKRIIRGEEKLPEGLNPLALVKAAEEHIQKTGDAEMAYDLANSPHVSESSQAAQTMRLAAEREPDSLTTQLRELKKAKEEAIKKRTGKDVKKAVSDTVEQIKKSKPKAKKEDWASFIESIQC